MMHFPLRPFPAAADEKNLISFFLANLIHCTFQLSAKCLCVENPAVPADPILSSFKKILLFWRTESRKRRNITKCK